MKLFIINIAYGTATAVAKDKIGVLTLIVKHPVLQHCFTDLNGTFMPSQQIIDHINEVPGYTVSGETESIIDWYRE